MPYPPREYLLSMTILLLDVKLTTPSPLTLTTDPNEPPVLAVRKIFSATTSTRDLSPAERATLLLASKRTSRVAFTNTDVFFPAESAINFFSASVETLLVNVSTLKRKLLPPISCPA